MIDRHSVPMSVRGKRVHDLRPPIQLSSGYFNGTYEPRGLTSDAGEQDD